MDESSCNAWCGFQEVGYHSFWRINTTTLHNNLNLTYRKQDEEQSELLPCSRGSSGKSKSIIDDEAHPSLLPDTDLRSNVDLQLEPWHIEDNFPIVLPYVQANFVFIFVVFVVIIPMMDP